MYLLIHSVFLEILSCLVPSHQINMNRLKLTVAVVFIFPVLGCTGGADVSQTTDERDPSVARLWNEVLLEAIRNDFARPTVHARNLFHISAAMYDAWAVFDVTAGTFLLDKQVGGYGCPLDYVP